MVFLLLVVNELVKTKNNEKQKVTRLHLVCLIFNHYLCNCMSNSNYKPIYTKEEQDKAEDTIQNECWIWFHNEYCTGGNNDRDMIYAIPNGGKRDWRTAKTLKNTGTLAGVADLHLIVNGYFVFVEMKTTKGYTSKVQNDFRDRVKAHGYPYHVVRTLAEFQMLVRHYYGKPRFYMKC